MHGVKSARTKQMGPGKIGYRVYPYLQSFWAIPASLHIFLRYLDLKPHLYPTSSQKMRLHPFFQLVTASFLEAYLAIVYIL